MVLIATRKTWKILTKLSIAAVALFISAPQVCAADVAVLSTTTTAMGDDPICNVRLSGPIVPGDNKKLESALDTVSPRGNASDMARSVDFPPLAEERVQRASPAMRRN
jgi:hypothetical protein